MNESMMAAKGLGLAANQVGQTVRAFSIDLSHFDVLAEPKIIINPEIMETSDEKITGEEGCLSFPGLFQLIQRPHKVTIKTLDLNGKEYYFEDEGLIARVILHEFDHLNGVLFIDKLTPAQRILIKSKLTRIKAGERV
jgi:peptide deformylase